MFDDEYESLGNPLMGNQTEELAYEEEPIEVQTYSGNREYDAGPNTGSYGYVEVELDGELKQCTNAYMSNAYGGQYCVGDTYTDPNGGSQIIRAINPTGIDLAPAQWDAAETYSDVGEKMGMSLEEWTEFSAEIQQLNETVDGLKGNLLGPTEQQIGRLGIRIKQENPDWTEAEVMAEAHRMLEEQWQTSDAYREAALAETALFEKYGMTKPNPAIYGTGIWVDEDGKYHRWESSSGNFYQTSQNDGFLDYAVPIGIAIGASLIGGQIGAAFTGGLSSTAAGAVNSTIGSAISQGLTTGGIDPSKLLSAAMMGGIGGMADSLKNMDSAIAEGGVLGTADDIVNATSKMLNLNYDQALELLQGVAEGAVSGADLESIVMGAIGNYSSAQINSFLKESFGDTLNVDDWFKDGQSNIPTEALFPLVEGAVGAAIEGGMSGQDALKMAWGYFDQGGDIDFMLPAFKNMVSGWDLDFQLPFDISKGDDWSMTQDEDGVWQITWTGINVNLPEDWEIGDPCSDEEGNEGFLNASGICDFKIDPIGCAEGETWDETLGACIPDIVECMEGFDWDGQQCVKIPGPIDPIGCAEGETWDEVLGACIPDMIECLEGFDWDGQQCVKIPGPIDPIGCGPGETWDEVLGQCVPDIIECVEGFEWDGQQCVKIPDITPIGCGPGETWDEVLGQCVPDIIECMEGFQWDDLIGECVKLPIIDPIGCGPGLTWDERLGECVPDVVECMQGWEWSDLYQECVEIEVPGPIDPIGCGPGETWDEVLGQCVPDIIECLEGFDWDGQQCVKIEGPEDPEFTCPEGFRDEDGQCVPIEIENPCGEGGWLDDAGICQGPEGPRIGGGSPFKTSRTPLFGYTTIDIYKAPKPAPIQNYIKKPTGGMFDL